MRAGGSPPATPYRIVTLVVGELRTFNEGRGFTPGDTTRSLCSTGTTPSAFNEGRGFTPGDTRKYRSPSGDLISTFNEGRGFTPGDTCGVGSLRPSLKCVQ